MHTLIASLLGRLPHIGNWQSIRQYLIISISPLLLIATIYLWNYNFKSGSANSVLSVTSSTPEVSQVQASTSAVPTPASVIYIDISGAVNLPGIKQLAVSARVNDAIWSAEGFTNQADKEYLAQALNLAQPLRDGDKIYIPTYTEVSLSLPKPPILLNKINQPLNVISVSESVQGGKDENSGNQKDVAVKTNINNASQAQLEDLPGIGTVNAQNIIAGRPYTSTTELCSKKIITNTSTCEKIQDLITF